MADAMVVARMSAAKKKAAARVLESLGSNASQAINELYDYLIAEKQLPWQEGPLKSTASTKKLAEALKWVDALSVSIPPKYASMSIKDARRKRLGI